MTPTFTFQDGLTIPRIGFGTMRLTGQPGNFGPYEDWEGGIALLRRARNLGVTHFDTARAYGPHHSERLIADAFGGETQDLFIATKGGVEKTGPGGRFITTDSRPESLTRHLEDSLRDLGVERIALYYLHRPDGVTPIEDSIAALAAARDAGKIVRIGLSNVTLEKLKRAETVARIDAVQNRYDAGNGGDEAVLDYTTERGIAFVPWGPLGANPMRRGAPLATAKGGTGAALRALLERAPNILPIPGTTTLAHLEENVAAGATPRRTA